MRILKINLYIIKHTYFGNKRSLINYYLIAFSAEAFFIFLFRLYNGI